MHNESNILFQQWAINIIDLPFLKYSDIGKGHAMRVSHFEMMIERDEQKASESEPDLDRMAQ